MKSAGQFASEIVTGIIVGIGVLIIWSMIEHYETKRAEERSEDLRWRAKIEHTFLRSDIDSADHVSIHNFMDAQVDNNLRYDTTLINHNKRILTLEKYFP